MAKKKKPLQKSPWGKHSAEAIFRTERDAYVIQVGVDLFDANGKMVFSSKSAAIYYNQILNNLLNVIDGGDETEKQDAIRCLGLLRIHPLRIN